MGKNTFGECSSGQESLREGYGEGIDDGYEKKE